MIIDNMTFVLTGVGSLIQISNVKPWIILANPPLAYCIKSPENRRRHRVDDIITNMTSIRTLAI